MALRLPWRAPRRPNQHRVRSRRKQCRRPSRLPAQKQAIISNSIKHDLGQVPDLWKAARAGPRVRRPGAEDADPEYQDTTVELLGEEEVVDAEGHVRPRMLQGRNSMMNWTNRPAESRA